MNQLNLLWEYQTADIEVENISREIKQSPNRQQLLKYRESLLEHQKTLGRIEEEVVTMQDRMEALRDAIHRIESQIQSIQERVQAKEPESTEETERYISEVKRLISNLNDYESEIKRIRTDSTNREKLQRDVKLHAARIKKEFDKLKEVYDTEYSKMNERLTDAKARAKDKAKAITPAYLEKYQTIKRHSFPPLARMVGSQCTGCNMSLPSGVVKDVQSGKEIECETCGRLLIYGD